MARIFPGNKPVEKVPAPPELKPTQTDQFIAQKFMQPYWKINAIHLRPTIEGYIDALKPITQDPQNAHFFAAHFMMAIFHHELILIDRNDLLKELSSYAAKKHVGLNKIPLSEARDVLLRSPQVPHFLDAIETNIERYLKLQKYYMKGTVPISQGIEFTKVDALMHMADLMHLKAQLTTNEDEARSLMGSVLSFWRELSKSPLLTAGKQAEIKALLLMQQTLIKYNPDAPVWVSHSLPRQDFGADKSDLNIEMGGIPARVQLKTIPSGTEAVRKAAIAEELTKRGNVPSTTQMTVLVQDNLNAALKEFDRENDQYQKPVKGGTPQGFDSNTIRVALRQISTGYSALPQSRKDFLNMLLAA